MNELVGYEVEVHKTGWGLAGAWKKLGCLTALGLLGSSFYLARTKMQFSGRFEGPIEVPNSGKIWMKLDVQHVGASMTAKVELLHTYGQRYVQRTGVLRGVAQASEFELSGQLNSGERLELTGSAAMQKDQMQLQGQAKLPNFSVGVPFRAEKKH
jgi:hypothetical protein